MLGCNNQASGIKMHSGPLDAGVDTKKTILLQPRTWSVTPIDILLTPSTSAPECLIIDQGCVVAKLYNSYPTGTVAYEV